MQRGTITALAGCDLLTISRTLLAQLAIDRRASACRARWTDLRENTGRWRR